jgi:hypothetical protein
MNWLQMTGDELRLRADMSEYFKLSPFDVDGLMQNVEFVQYAAAAIESRKKSKQYLAELDVAVRKLTGYLEEERKHDT